MKFRAILTSTVFLLLGSLFGALPVKAIDLPSFPSCTSPAGRVLVSYDSGVHGIVGSSGEYEGSDIVYTVSDSNLTQCFCAVSGSGIQTNWWKIGSLSIDQITYLKNLGWVYVADGSAWGLDATAYLAINSSFSCNGSQITPTPIPAPTGYPQPCNSCSGPPTAPVCTAAVPPTPQLISVVRSGTTAQITWTAVTPATHYAIFYGTDPNNYIYGVPNTGNVTSFVIGSLTPGIRYYFQIRAVNDCMPSSGSTSGQVLGASTTTSTGQILGLASTGSQPLIWALSLSAIISFGFYLVTRKLFHREK